VTRVVVIVEGQTEEAFVNGPLAEALWPYQVFLTAVLLGVPGHKGGRPNYPRVQKDILSQLKQDQTAYCSTMIDYYGLGPGFPGLPLPPNLTPLQSVEHIEHFIQADIQQRIPDFRPDLRLIPYLSLHEYEALLFSDPAAFAGALRRPNLASQFSAIRSDFATPEDIDNNPATAPSKRVIAEHPGYRKVIEGTLAARAVGIPRMREECPHFRSWINRIQNLPLLGAHL
jgi:hypothetical protein